MKIVFHAIPARHDIAELVKRFPEHQMVVAPDLVALAREIADAEVFVVSIQAYAPEFATLVNGNQKKLKWIQFTTSGIDKAVRAGGFPDGVLVTNCAGVSAPGVAEHAFALFMMVGRRFRDVDQATRAKHWTREELRPRMIALHGRTLCIAGLGAVGQEAAARAKAFGMKVIGISRAYRADHLVAEVYTRAHCKEALAMADFVLLSMSATSDAADFINADTLAVMKRTAIIANIARGDLIDEDALVAACREGRVAGAGLDVTKIEPTPRDSPLWTVPNIVITPHVAAAGADNSERMFEIIGDNIQRYVAGRPLTRVVDWPKLRSA